MKIRKFNPDEFFGYTVSMDWRNNKSIQPPSRKVGVAMANKMAAWKRDHKVLSFLARRVKQR